MEKEYLHQLLEECIELAEESDLKVLTSLLEGSKAKLSGKGSYIGRLLQMKRKHEKDRYEITLPLSALVQNNLGIVHGGITATVLDAAMGSLAYTALPEGYAAVTSQLNIHYLAPGTGADLRCVATFIHQGKQTLVVEGQIFREDGKKIAHATGTFFVVKHK